METQPTRYREIEVAGEPKELGQQIGEALREEIRGFSESAMESVHRTVQITKDRATEIARESTQFAKDYAPHMVDEIRGMADSSGVPFDDLMLLQVRNQFAPEGESGCTSFSVAETACVEGRAVVGQNWDNDPALDAFTVVLTRRPVGRPAFISITQAGLIAYIGFNDAGIGACLNTLPAPSRPVGVPHYFTLRGIYEAKHLAEAVVAVERVERAIPANIMLTTAQGPVDLEVTMDCVKVLRDSGDGLVTHTNHCLHPELSKFNDEFPELIQSKPRLARIRQQLTPDGGQITIEAMKTSLCDHQDYPRSICRHANDHPRHGFWETVFSVIMVPSAGEMHVSRGPPCSQPYATYRLN